MRFPKRCLIALSDGMLAPLGLIAYVHAEAFDSSLCHAALLYASFVLALLYATSVDPGYNNQISISSSPSRFAIIYIA